MLDSSATATERALVAHELQSSRVESAAIVKDHLGSGKAMSVGLARYHQNLLVSIAVLEERKRRLDEQSGV